MSSPEETPDQLRYSRDAGFGPPGAPLRRKVETKAGELGSCKFDIPEEDRSVIEFLERVRTALPAVASS